MSEVKTTNLELIIWYYIRNEYESKFIRINVPIPLKYLIAAFSKSIIGSRLMTLKEDMQFAQLLLDKISNIKRFNLLFRASKDGFTSKAFHNKCDNRGATITIIKSDFGNVFGGYTTVPWESFTTHGWFSVKLRKDDNAFIFLIRPSDPLEQNKCPLIFDINNEESDSAVAHSSERGPCFGKGCDISIRNKFGYTATNDAKVNCYTARSHSEGTYNYGQFKGALCGGNLIDKSFTFADCYCFLLLDYEVFQIR